MNKKYFLFAAITFIVIVTLGILAYLKFSFNPKQYFFVDTNGVEKKVTLLHSHEIQKKERVFVDKEVKLLFELSSESEEPLFKPGKVKTDEDGNIYVIDHSETSLKVYSPEGRFIRKYGRHGEGPGEFSRINDFYLTKEKKIYALDNSKIVVFNSNNITEIKLKSYGGINGIIPIDENQILLSKLPIKIDDGIFCIVNNEGKEISSSEPLYKVSQKYGLEGTLFFGEIFHSSYNTIFISQYFNLLFLYKENKIDKLITTVDEEEHPRVTVNSFEGGAVQSGPDHKNNKIINYKSALINDSLYIMSMPAWKQYKKFIFDVYDANTGKYIHSIRFNHKESFSGISLSSKRLFIVGGDGNLKVYGFE